MPPVSVPWHTGAVFLLELPVFLLIVLLQEREGRSGAGWVANGSVDGKCTGWRWLSSA